MLDSASIQPADSNGGTRTRAGLLAARDRLEVRFGGTAEQGVLLMGVALAVAATLDHRYVVQTETYDLEECDEGYGHSDVIISDGPIDFPELQAADLLVVLSQEPADEYGGLLRKDGVLIYDSDRVAAPPTFGGTCLGLPFERSALEATDRVDPAVDIFTLGVVVGLTGVASVSSLRNALTGRARLEAADVDNALAEGVAVGVAEWQRSGGC